ncbi:MAG TPA: GNAT family N-acetyltransferase [Blastocatellia bacterium]|nr:GNAT family N-acetyltransferase [Blastocatellia bacterium]
MEIAIRKAKPDDHERLTEIAHAAKRHWGYPERWIEAWKDVLTITPEFITGCEVYAAVAGDEVAGFYALIPAQGKVSLEHMWVAPDRIGAGVGKELFDHALKVAAGLDASSIEIESDPNAEGFYKRMGARRIGEVASEIEGQPRLLPLLTVDLDRTDLKSD